jgi:hypothetical protein
MKVAEIQNSNLMFYALCTHQIYKKLILQVCHLNPAKLHKKISDTALKTVSDIHF